VVESKEIDLVFIGVVFLRLDPQSGQGKMKQPAMRNSIGPVVGKAKFHELSLSICINCCRLW
tara:strand:+ start:444 stop:629 length:186 start_codon:yes stop_codon:yes gene_type:complete